jgi:ribosome-dependent ATPase
VKNQPGGEPEGRGEPVVRLCDVSHRYGKTFALEGISLEIPAGCLAGLIGPDGVGKSTLLGLVAGTRRIQSGRVEVRGCDLARRRGRRAIRTEIAYMAQGLGTNLYPDLSTRENLDFFGRLFGLEREVRQRRIEGLLGATGLARFADRHARKLSGGMSQKLGLCCALIHEPALLVLDEPTTGVDPLSRRQFWELLDRMRRRRPELSVIVATAYMEEAERFDWLAVMHAGSAVATGAPAAIQQESGADSLEATYAALVSDRERERREQLEPASPEESGSEVAIDAHRLTKRFGDFTAVDEVSFEIRRGEIFGFVGSNGSGKTTTMKMLTGLLPASEGEARLFGRPLHGRDRATRRRVGFMSQRFSLYRELTVRQNLELHARLYGIAGEDLAERVGEAQRRFDLERAANARAERLPLGVRQRLSLAVAVLHRPEVLILDEPTSGVDPMARDDFWDELIQLSRRDGVTIFLSTHFMNEAERCDRIALMHEGRVLATGSPGELTRELEADSLEAAFIGALEKEGATVATPGEGEPLERGRRARRQFPRFDPRRLLAVANREAREIARDPIRLAFALLGPMLLLVVIGYGISFDVEDLRFAAWDRDRTRESRRYLESFRGSRYFREQPAIRGDADLERRLRSGELALAVQIPAGFGRELWRGEDAEVGIWIDGAMPFKAETARAYVQGLHRRFLDDLSRRGRGRDPPVPPVRIEPRFRYNQEFESVYAIVPGVMMLVLVLIPAIMTAVGVVREKELGSIANFYVTPTTRLEFLVGKQLPYLAVGFLGFLLMAVLALLVFRVPVQERFPALAVGALLYVTATTSLGLLISTFVKSQLAAIFANAILTTLPAIQFSGLLVPVSSLTGGAWWFGRGFPSSWFQQVTLGTCAKGLGVADLLLPYAMLAAFAALYLTAACLLLRKQER